MFTTDYTLHPLADGRYNVVCADGHETAGPLSLMQAADLIRMSVNGANFGNLNWKNVTKNQLPEVLEALGYGMYGADGLNAHQRFLAHQDTCERCLAGRTCNSWARLAREAQEGEHCTRAPVAAENGQGVMRGFWCVADALAWVEEEGGEVVRAPAGALEAELKDRARAAAEAKEAQALQRHRERRAAWKPKGRPHHR